MTFELMNLEKRPNRPKSLPIEFNLAIGLDK